MDQHLGDGYKQREDGMFLDYNEAIRVIHDLTQFIDCVMLTEVSTGEVVRDVLPKDVVESIDLVTTNIHYASCTRLREMGIITPNGATDMVKYQEALLEVIMGNAPLAEPEVTINSLVDQQLRDILNKNS